MHGQPHIRFTMCINLREGADRSFWYRQIVFFLTAIIDSVSDRFVLDDLLQMILTHRPSPLLLPEPLL